jgi:chromosome partitioning protein
VQSSASHPISREAPVLVVGSNKGGIGRTVTAVNLAAILALAGRRTLLIDLDPKGDATAGVGLPRLDAQPRSLEWLQDPERFLQDVRAAERPSGLDVWPGGPALEELQAELWRQEQPPTNLLDKGLARAREQYKVIVIDAPPALDPLGCNALAAASVLLLPLSGGSFSEAALEETMAMARELCMRPLKVLGVRLRLREEDTETPAPDMPGSSGTLNAAIAYDAITLREATELGLPVFEHAPESRVARSFIELGREVITRVIDDPGLPV